MPTSSRLDLRLDLRFVTVIGVFIAGVEISGSLTAGSGGSGFLTLIFSVLRREVQSFGGSGSVELIVVNRLSLVLVRRLTAGSSITDASTSLSVEDVAFSWGTPWEICAWLMSLDGGDDCSSGTSSLEVPISLSRLGWVSSMIVSRSGCSIVASRDVDASKASGSCFELKLNSDRMEPFTGSFDCR